MGCVFRAPVVCGQAFEIFEVSLEPGGWGGLEGCQQLGTRAFVQQGCRTERASVTQVALVGMCTDIGVPTSGSTQAMQDRLLDAIFAGAHGALEDEVGERLSGSPAIIIECVHNVARVCHVDSVNHVYGAVLVKRPLLRIGFIRGRRSNRPPSKVPSSWIWRPFLIPPRRNLRSFRSKFSFGRCALGEGAAQSIS